MKKNHLSNPAALKLKMATEYRRMMRLTGQKTTLLLIADHTVSELTCQVENTMPGLNRKLVLSMERPVRPVRSAKPVHKPQSIYDRVSLMARGVIASVGSWIVYGLINVLKR
ncbi:hypothetical protein [Spirosoma pollinicola]|uniref:Uncharacterized protein n=1 Tax=Spirosoma pollinicola TaxID=2057025 RepID=A0A2K8YTS1_9BACT|nr:hypothetical protein [Spirosoma pollinicola]AUD00979.1 hypothetical protein CWM47_03580 [Spirosoma pollinicola]